VFYDTARGCWVGSVDIGRDPETGRRRRRKVSAPTKTECKDLLDALREEKRKTGTVGRRDVTVETVVRARLDNPPPRVKSAVSRRVHEAHGARIVAALGRKLIAKLTPGDVDRFLADMARDGYARKTIADTLRLLEDAIRRAERDGLVGRNVASLADMPSAGVKKSRAMTLAQVGALLGSGLDPWMRAYVSVGVMCGLRPGELLGLRWEDVDLDGRVIRVRHALVEGEGGKVELGELKNEQSARTMAMPAVAASALRALRAEQAAARLRVGAAYADTGLVLCRPDGSQSARTTVYKRFQRACGRAGLGGDWHPHEMRHTFVSLLSAHGVDIDDIADAAGHVNATVTRVTYRHQISDKLARAAAAMDQIFGAGGAR
jgi:integrase